MVNNHRQLYGTSSSEAAAASLTPVAKMHSLLDSSQINAVTYDHSYTESDPVLLALQVTVPEEPAQIPCTDPEDPQCSQIDFEELQNQHNEFDQAANTADEVFTLYSSLCQALPDKTAAAEIQSQFVNFVQNGAPFQRRQPNQFNTNPNQRRFNAFPNQQFNNNPAAQQGRPFQRPFQVGNPNPGQNFRPPFRTNNNNNMFNRPWDRQQPQQQQNPVQQQQQRPQMFNRFNPNRNFPNQSRPVPLRQPEQQQQSAVLHTPADIANQFMQLAKLANVAQSACLRCGASDHQHWTRACALTDLPLTNEVCGKCKVGLHEARRCARDIIESPAGAAPAPR
jgi:hypothetical protein